MSNTDKSTDGGSAQDDSGTPRSVQEAFDKIAHLFCYGCRDNPSLALVQGNEVLVCHCTHDDGDLDPLPVHGFDSLPEQWKFVEEGGS